MPTEIKGKIVASGAKFAIVVSRYNEFITSKLCAGALGTLTQHGAADGDITVVHVPGAFELPIVAKKLANGGGFSAIICLGCVIRGQTPHFDFVAGQAARGIAEVGMSSGVPTTFGVITADTLEQAIERAGSEGSNKGVEASLSAIELVNVLKQLPTS